MSAALGETGANVWSLDPFGYSYLAARGHRAVRNLDELPSRQLFDGIVAVQVLEHLTKPWETVAHLRTLLKPAGWLLIITPNPRGLNARLAGVRWREARKPGHLTFFAPPSMELLLAKSGFTVCRRLSWHVRYRAGWISRLKDFCLSVSRLGGDLRYLAQ